MSFRIEVRATSVLITPGKEAMGYLTPLINLHTYEDEFVGETKTLGFLYDEAHDTLYFHKGIDIQYVRRLLPGAVVENNPYDPYKEMRYQFEEIIPPRDEDQVSIIHFITGEHEYSSNAKDQQIFLVFGTGGGKAEPYTRKIPTPTQQGYTLMRDLRAGDFVFGQDGKPTKVIGVFEQGLRDTYEITFSDGRTAYCADDHLWKVFTGGGSSYVIKTKDLLNLYKYKINRAVDNNTNRDPYAYRFKIPVCKPVEYPTRDDLPIDPWVLGCFIGNGCCRERTLTISAGTDEVPVKIAKILGFYVKRKSVFNYSYTFYHPETHKPVTTEEFFAQIPEFIHAYSDSKRIPSNYMYSDKQTRLSLLQGLMDTDGYISINESRFHVGYTSTSRGLLEDIRKLIYSFGWSCGIKVDTRSEKYRTKFCGTIIFRMPNSCKYMLFRTKKKLGIAMRAKHIHQNNRYNGLIIKNIRSVGRVPCKCIMVDNPEHLYLTENFIVTHNTFCAGYSAGILGYKTLIIVHRDNLRMQWVESLYNLNGFGSDVVHELTNTQELVAIANGQLKYDYDIYIMTHATFQAACNRLGDAELIGNITRNLGIGFKIIDEAHLYFRDTLMIDFLFNVKRNLYLTATDGRSSKDENSIFKHVFANTTFYRKLATNSKHPDKWVDYISIMINTHVNPNIYRYRIAPGGRMSTATYGKWVIQKDKEKTYFKVIIEILRDIYKGEPTAKVLVFLPLIDLCTECAYEITQALNYDDTFEYDLNVKTVNSHNSKAENELNKRADVIVTTIQSLGTGSDIKGITDIICCSPMVSKIVVQQVLGRIRYINKPCHYYDIVNTSVQMDVFWWKSRSKTLKRMCKSYQQLTWVDEPKKENENDTA